MLQISLLLQVQAWTTSIGVRELLFFFAATRASDSTQLASNTSAPTDRSQLASNAPAPTTASNPAKRHHVPSHTMPALTGQMVSFLSDKPWYSPAKYHNFLRLVNLAPFSRTPIGPIGTQLRLVDAKWAVAVKVALGSVLESFVVDSHADGTVLKVRSSCIKSLLHLPHHHLPIPHRKSAFRNLNNDDDDNNNNDNNNNNNYAFQLMMS